MSTFLRRLSNPFNLYAPSTRRRSDNDLAPWIKDDVFRLHVSGDPTNFPRLDAQSLITAQVVPSLSYAAKVLSACHKTGVIDPSTGHPCTQNISRDMVKSMPVIRVEQQRQLVMLLFWWEEEIVRWRLLEAEADGVREREAEMGRVEMGERLRVLEAKKRILPSLRDESGRVLEREEEEQLPGYVEREGR